MLILMKIIMKIIAWNVNGLNSLVKTDYLDSLIKNNNPDILCLSETKLTYITQPNIDILINNAGIRHISNILDHTKKQWDEMLSGNLTGPYLCCKAVIPYMIKNGKGKIVNFGSIAMRIFCASGLQITKRDHLENSRKIESRSRDYRNCGHHV